jgi:hypothetical protein
LVERITPSYWRSQEVINGRFLMQQNRMIAGTYGFLESLMPDKQKKG